MSGSVKRAGFWRYVLSGKSPQALCTTNKAILDFHFLDSTILLGLLNFNRQNRQDKACRNEVNRFGLKFPSHVKWVLPPFEVEHKTTTFYGFSGSRSQGRANIFSLHRWQNLLEVPRPPPPPLSKRHLWRYLAKIQILSAKIHIQNILRQNAKIWLNSNIRMHKTLRQIQPKGYR